MHDMLRKMLHAPVFLDSSSLADLRKLITEGVHKSETVLLLATKGVLSRPCAAGIRMLCSLPSPTAVALYDAHLLLSAGCLLEMLEASRQQIPIIVIKMANGGFDFADSL
eukprot:1082561-Prymnesium_polylepis.2